MPDDADSAAERDAVHRPIAEAASGARRLTGTEMERVLGRVAAAGSDPHAHETVRGYLAGTLWHDRILRGSDRLPPAERHDVRHVLRAGEWPEGTGLDDYVESIRRVILDEASGVYTGLYHGTLQLGVIRRSNDLRGPNGTAWVLVEYRLETGYWTTAHQPSAGLRDLNTPARERVRWLRRVRLRAK